MAYKLVVGGASSQSYWHHSDKLWELGQCVEVLFWTVCAVFLSLYRSLPPGKIVAWLQAWKTIFGSSYGKISKSIITHK